MIFATSRCRMTLITKLSFVGGKRTDIIHARDENGWQAIHEAARGGYTDIVKYLVELGADVTAQTISAQASNIELTF